MPGDRRRTFLAECYWLGVDEQRFAAAIRRTTEAVVGMRHEGLEVRFLGSILVPADETVVWLFDGEAAVVRAVGERVGAPFERVLQSLHSDGGTKEDEG